MSSNEKTATEAAMADVIDLFGRGTAVAELKGGYRAFRLFLDGEPEGGLFLVFRNNVDYLILSYADLESIGNPPGADPNEVVLLRFRGTAPREVRIEGLRLLDLVDQLWHQRAACIKEMPEGWSGPLDGSVPVVTRMSVREV
jgi:hypothetical protein